MVIHYFSSTGLVLGFKSSLLLLWVFRVFNNPNVTVHFNTQTVDIEADDKGQMAGLTLRDIESGEVRSLKVRGLFYGIGHQPNSELLRGQVELDEAGYVLVEPGTTNTSVEGVYAAGDLQVSHKNQTFCCN